MGTIIGSARINERGGIGGGAPGDQTGKETMREPWYKHELGWYVLRPKSPRHAYMIARNMEAICDNQHVGYCQETNQSLLEECRKYSYDVSKVARNVNVDCARAVRVCVLYAGIWSGDFYTVTLKDRLMETGAFDLITDPKVCDSERYLRRGDILVTRSKGHAVVVISGMGDSLAKVKAKADVYIRRTPSLTGWAESVLKTGQSLMFEGSVGVDSRGVDWYCVVVSGGSYGWVSSKHAEVVV